jgi:LDH2 family malate/lactate/ureidoglycolate dehydrogenase
MPTFAADELRTITANVFQAAGVPAEVAERVSESLVESNLLGHDSHGVIRIMQYLRDLRRGLVDPQARVEVLKETTTTALLDAHWQFGQVAARRGMAMAIEKARASHLAAVAMAHCYHIGRLGEYAAMAAEQGLIGLVTCNTGGPGVAPYGGKGRLFGTNPVACALPAGRHAPFLMDFATATVAEGKLRVARAQGKAVPEGWILDRDGRATTDPTDFYEGGVLLPFGGHKGYALCLLVDLLGGALAGHGCTCLPEFTGGNGVFILVLDIEAFRPLAEWQDTADRLFDRVKACPAAPGFEQVMIPGEPELAAKARRLRDGIEIDDSTWQEIVRVAREAGVEVDGTARRP